MPKEKPTPKKSWYFELINHRESRSISTFVQAANADDAQALFDKGKGNKIKDDDIGWDENFVAQGLVPTPCRKWFKIKKLTQKQKNALITCLFKNKSVK